MNKENADVVQDDGATGVDPVAGDPVPVVAAGPGDAMTKQAGYAVMVISGLIIVLVMATLLFQLYKVEGKYGGVASGLDMMEHCKQQACTETTMRLLLEQDAQVLRNDRVRSALNMRLIIFVVAEVVALTMIVMGGVLVFDRVQSLHRSSIEVDRIKLMTTFPGLIMCLLGTMIVGGSIWISSQRSSMMKIVDLPVYIRDVNLLSTYAGYSSMTGPTDAPEEKKTGDKGDQAETSTEVTPESMPGDDQ
jgi:hypothetical protein